MTNLNKMKKAELLEYCKKIKEENECIKNSYKYELGDNAELSKEYNELEKENEKLKKENDNYFCNYIEREKYNEIREKGIKFKEENERLLKLKRELDDRNTEITDLFNKTSQENQVLKKVDKNKALNKILADKKHLIEVNKNNWKEIEKLRNENISLEKQVDRLEKAYEELEKEYKERTQEHSNYWSKSIELERYNELKEENEKFKEENEKLKKEIKFNSQENLHFTSLETELNKYISFVNSLDNIRETLEIERDTNF